MAETCELRPINVYGTTKKMVEEFLWTLTDKNLCQFVALRYFNAAGCSSQYEIGEFHHPETHLIPNLCKSIATQKPLSIYGDHYPTKDGTCIRDYVHVEDLSKAHCLAMDYLLSSKHESHAINLGSTCGYSILDIVQAAQQTLSKDLRYEIHPHRKGDPAVLVADCTKAFHILGWKPQRNLETMLTSAYSWYVKNA
ncbi:MAG: GDP-mannose 4,6-dehydratase [Bdellovibrionota bacterium]